MMKMNMRPMYVMVAAALPALGVASPAAAQVVTIDWVTVGNAGNVADPTTGFGNVGYAYRIGATEVTNEKYAAFLNAVAASDPNGLYNTSMGSDPRGGITRSGSDGSYTYTTRPNMGNKPVNYVNWYDAARMSNWMTNGQGSGGTESGVYTFNGPQSISAITRDLSNPKQVFIPTENEWYKAAYHQPASQGGDADNYWLYATQSNSVPTVASANAIGDIDNPGENVVNYAQGADWNGQNGNFTSVGSAGNLSFYDAFDMNGNAWEWNETIVTASFRGLRAGSFNSNKTGLPSFFRNRGVPSSHTFDIGLRLASPVPCLADFNSDTMVNVFDVVAFISDWNNPGLFLDFNNDGAVNVLDVVAFITVWNNGCP